MRVLGLNGKPYQINFNQYIVLANDKRRRSIPHIKARGLLYDMFKGYTLLEEVKLPGSRPPNKQSALFLDFLIPNLMLGIEVHGRQHYEFVPFYHKIEGNFHDSQHRDRLKAEWCDLNKVNLLILNADDTIEQWKEQIRNRPFYDYE